MWSDHIISAPEVSSIYDVPLNCERDKLSDILLTALGKRVTQQSDFGEWKHFAEKNHSGTGEVKIGIVGKYFDTGDFVLSDAYISVIEAIKYSAVANGTKVKIDWLNAKNYETNPESVSELKEYDGILVPGGFGETGIEGKINAIRFVRENKIPYFGSATACRLRSSMRATSLALRTRIPPRSIRSRRIRSLRYFPSR